MGPDPRRIGFSPKQAESLLGRMVYCQSPRRFRDSRSETRFTRDGCGVVSLTFIGEVLTAFTVWSPEAVDDLGVPYTSVLSTINRYWSRARLMPVEVRMRTPRIHQIPCRSAIAMSRRLDNRHDDHACKHRRRRHTRQQVHGAIVLPVMRVFTAQRAPVPSSAIIAPPDKWPSEAA